MTFNTHIFDWVKGCLGRWPQTFKIMWYNIWPLYGLLSKEVSTYCCSVAKQKEQNTQKVVAQCVVSSLYIYMYMYNLQIGDSSLTPIFSVLLVKSRQLSYIDRVFCAVGCWLGRCSGRSKVWPFEQKLITRNVSLQFILPKLLRLSLRIFALRKLKNRLVKHKISQWTELNTYWLIISVD